MPARPSPPRPTFRLRPSPDALTPLQRSRQSVGHPRVERRVASPLGAAHSRNRRRQGRPRPGVGRRRLASDARRGHPRRDRGVARRCRQAYDRHRGASCADGRSGGVRTDSLPVSPHEVRRSSRRVRGEWRCMHMPAARWPHASVRLAIWRESSPVKFRRSCKLSCANLGGHEGLKSRLLFSLPIILIIMRTQELSIAA